MVTSSDDRVVEDPRGLARALGRLQRTDKPIASGRKGHGRNHHSNQRERLYVRSRPLHARFGNVGSDRYHKVTTMIVESAGRVVEEFLSMAGRVRNRWLVRAMTDAGMSASLP